MMRTRMKIKESSRRKYYVGKETQFLNMDCDQKIIKLDIISF